MDKQQARRKATYGALYTSLVAILYTADLAGISHVARDEYAPEATTILPRLPEAVCAADVEQIIREAFAYWLYPGMTEQHPERFTWTARQTWRAWCAATAAQSPCRQRVTALWWASKLSIVALVTPVRKPGRMFRV